MSDQRMNTESFLFYLFAGAILCIVTIACFTTYYDYKCKSLEEQSKIEYRKYKIDSMQLANESPKL